MPRHTLGPCYVHFGPEMDAWCRIQAQNVHNKTQSFYGQHEDLCLGTTNYIFDGKMGSQGGGGGGAGSTASKTTMCACNVVGLS